MKAITKKSVDRPKGQWIRTDLRLAIYLRDEFHCVYCGKNLHGINDPQELTLDHVKPWSLGGKNTPSNLVTACRHCNCSRGAKKLTEYADAHTKKAIKRQTARSINKFRKLAKNIISGKSPEENL